MSRTLQEQRSDKLIYIGIGCCVAIIIVLGALMMSLNKKKDIQKMNFSENNENEISSEEASTSLGKTVEEMQEAENNSEEIQIQLGNNEVPEVVEENKQESVEKITENNVVNTNNDIENHDVETVIEPVKDPEFVMPVEGEVVKHYGKDKLIYSETLKEWTTHLGIDIKADKTTIVKASSNGKVKSIKNDPRYGLTVVIEHSNGFVSVYSNLLTAEFVVVGEDVKSGQTIGTVGTTATFEILDDAHLHFEILKDGNSIDPEMYIK